MAYKVREIKNKIDSMNIQRINSRFYPPKKAGDKNKPTSCDVVMLSTEEQGLKTLVNCCICNERRYLQLQTMTIIGDEITQERIYDFELENGRPKKELFTDDELDLFEKVLTKFVL